ncbi:PP2C family serine/threonine-protein phosphatase [Agitococcus lubricus]|uniref:Protein phosphatase 2C-like protein n=1 Tax=Agitococcus lubricus TaxID=1077255 RepID=A0A2T5J2K3_9GAMM|nr:PP2C family serine/threonine-protein phosphatase [Agitococcus lubricus]PTQ90753.1 protein phosphatase 2C-like protein [Agitococcus lubricus]
MNSVAQFHFVPAYVGRAYQQVPQTQSVAQWRICALDIATSTGLRFDEQQQALVGTPQQAGQYAVQIFYQATDKSTAILSAVAQLTIHADPRSLWQNIPSRPDIYPKPDSQSQMLNNSDYQLVAASQRGRAHAHKGLCRDDDYFIAAQENWAIAIVADGAGSANYSRYGAYLACQQAGLFLQQTLNQAPCNPQQVERYLQQAAACAWHAIEQAARQQHVSTNAYATTLLILVVWRQDGQFHYLSLGIGDGVLALYEPEQPLVCLHQPETGQYAGETQFLNAQTLAQVQVKHYVSLIPRAVWLMTDGVSDAFFESENALQQPQHWQQLDAQIGTTAQQAESLLAWLDFWSAGNHDDRTIVLLRRRTNESSHSANSL